MGFWETWLPLMAFSPCPQLFAKHLTLGLSCSTCDRPQVKASSWLTRICHTHEQGSRPEVPGISRWGCSSVDHIFLGDWISWVFPCAFCFKMWMRQSRHFSANFQNASWPRDLHCPLRGCLPHSLKPLKISITLGAGRLSCFL